MLLNLTRVTLNVVGVVGGDRIQSYPLAHPAPNKTTFHPNNAPTCHVSVASRLAVASSKPVMLDVNECSSALNPSDSAQTAGKRMACGMRVSVGMIGGSGRESMMLPEEEGLMVDDEGLMSEENWSSGRTARKGTWEAIGVATAERGGEEKVERLGSTRAE